MTQAARITVVDTGSYLDKYVVRQLTDSPLHPKQRVTLSPQAEPDSTHVIEASGDTIIVREQGGASRTVRVIGHNVVGTGMTGPVADIVKRIYRGNYFHVSGDESRISAVHAVDMAKAAVRAVADGSLEGDYTLTDGIAHPRHDFVEALACRLDGKRVFTLTDKRARRMALIGDFLPIMPLDSRRLRGATTDDLADSSRWFAAVADWEPTDVVQYLTTHNYDETSL